MKIYNSFEEIFSSIPVGQFKKLSAKDKERYIGKAKWDRGRKGDLSWIKDSPSYSGNNTNNIDRFALSEEIKKRYNDAIMRKSHPEDVLALDKATPKERISTLSGYAKTVAMEHGLKSACEDTHFSEFSHAKFNPDGSLKSILVKLDDFYPVNEEYPV